MAKEERSKQLLALQSLFESGNIKQMRDIEEMYPTLIAKALRINHSRYIQKLYKPEEFTIRQIFDLANLIDIHPRLILEIIIKQYKIKNS